MADKKISELDAAAALTGTEVAPLVQSGGNVKATIQQITTAVTGATGTNGETVTTSKPRLDLTQTWNAGGTTFTGLKFNATDTASAAASNLMVLQTNGANRFAVTPSGSITAGSTNSTLQPRSVGTGFRFDNFAGAGNSFGFTVALNSTTNGYTWANEANSPTVDLGIFRDAADTLAQRRTTNAQTFRIYNTFTDASNYERGKMEWASNVLRIGTEKAGTGTARSLELQTDGTTRLTIGTTGTITHSFSDSAGSFSVENSAELGVTSGGNVNIYTTNLPNAGDQKLGQFLFGSTSGGVKNSASVTALSGAGWSAGSSHPTYIAFSTTAASSASRAERMRITPAGLLAFGGGATSSFPALKRSSTTLQVRLADDTANAPLESASVKTDDPTGGTSGTWKLGVAATVSPTSPNRTIEVDIGGTIYYIAAKTTND